MSEHDLIKIVCKASTVNDRLSGSFTRTAKESDRVADARYQRWCQVVAGGNRSQFEHRLALNNLNPAKARRALGAVCLTDGQSLPPWVDTLREAVRGAASMALPPCSDRDAREYRFFDAGEPLPFEDAFLPFLIGARQKLIAAAGSCYSLLSEQSHAALERALLRRLSYLCSRAMQLEFSIFGESKRPWSFSSPGQPQDKGSRLLYKKFIEKLMDDRLLTFFQEYAVLARLVATVTDLWVESTGEFLQRLESDWAEIQRTFQEDGQLGQVVTLLPNLSDRHNGGRAVMALTFASGLKLIYKPKDLGMEQAYNNLLDWLNQHGVSLPLKTLKVLNQSGYGWVKFAEQCPCTDQQEARRYYLRAGMMLCLVYALQGIDFQWENVIACGEHLVIVDVETLMYPYERDFEAVEEVESTWDMANAELGTTVLSTNLLPQWQGWLNGRGYDASGLAGAGGQEMPFRIRKWENINTDTMKLRYEYAKTVDQYNIPSLRDARLSAGDYVEEIVTGFRQMYRFVLEQREAMLAPTGPLSHFRHQKVRFVFRPTTVYGVLLRKLLDPGLLRDGADRSIHLDILSSTLLSTGSKNPLWPLLEQERQSLEQEDIPFFTASTDSEDLTAASGQVLEKCFIGPSFDLAVSRLSKLDDDDLEKQAAIILGSLHSHAVLHASSSKSPVPNPDLGVLLSPDELVREALAIADGLRRRAVRLSAGGVGWIAMTYIPKTQSYQLRMMGYSLYDGCCGVSLFLAAVEKVTGGAGFRNLALDALEPLRRDLRDGAFQRIVRLIGDGDATSCGSVIYALVRISHLLNEPALLEETQRVVSLITVESIEADRRFDIVSGAAGSIVGLLALYDCTYEREALARAVACGHHLVNNRVAASSGHRAWAPLSGTVQTGFSHGAAGIAYALLRLYKTTAESEFLEAALEAHSFEREVFVETEGNWPDLRFPKTGTDYTYGSSWCHGAPGIGLARLAGLNIIDSPESRGEVEAAIGTTMRIGLQDLDQLCCGNLGRVEFLFEAAVRLHRPRLMEFAREQTAQVIARARQRRTYGLTGTNEANASGFFPGFYQGEAGIGYELLRLGAPKEITSVLLWE